MWLISKGKLQEAEKILKKAAKVNKKSLPDNCLTGKKILRKLINFNWSLFF